MLVLDASIVVEVTLPGPGSDVLRERLGEGDLHAPQLIDIEVTQALRRLTRAGTLSIDRAGDALIDLRELDLLRYPHEPLIDRIWELRDNLSAYDAAYVTLAEALGAPLLTSDGRLARAAGGTGATVELLD